MVKNILLINHHLTVEKKIKNYRKDQKVTDLANSGRNVKLMLQCLPFSKKVRSVPLGGTPLSA